MGFSGWARNSDCFVSTAFALFPGNHLQVNNSLRRTSTRYSSPAMALFGLGRLLTLQPGVVAS